MTALLEVAVFKGMDPAKLDRIEAGSRLLEPRDRTKMFTQGDAADAVYAIVAGSGHVRIGALDRKWRDEIRRARFRERVLVAGAVEAARRP